MSPLRAQTPEQRAAYVKDLAQAFEDAKKASAQADDELITTLNKMSEVGIESQPEIKAQIEKAMAKAENTRSAREKIRKIIDEFTTVTGTLVKR